MVHYLPPWTCPHSDNQLIGQEYRHGELVVKHENVSQFSCIGMSNYSQLRRR